MPVHLDPHLGGIKREEDEDQELAGVAERREGLELVPEKEEPRHDVPAQPLTPSLPQSLCTMGRRRLKEKDSEAHDHLGEGRIKIARVTVWERAASCALHCATSGERTEKTEEGLRQSENIPATSGMVLRKRRFQDGFAQHRASWPGVGGEKPPEDDGEERDEVHQVGEGRAHSARDERHARLEVQSL
jgi:hypothetical protein